MASSPEERRPLVNSEFAWFTRRNDGKMGATIGPDPFTADNEDMWLTQDPNDPMLTIFVSSPSDAIQRFITVAPDEYAVIHNPSQNFSPEHPNGSWRSGKNSDGIPSLVNGTKRVVAGGHFPFWPGQRIERRKVHRLTTSEYLVVIVESDKIDETAPYYNLTKRCAAIRQAVVDKTVASKEQVLEKPTVEQTESNSEETPETTTPATTKSDIVPPTNSGEMRSPVEEVTFIVGQRIIIPGNMTPTYIPPSGIEVEDQIEMPAEVTDSPVDLDVVNDRIMKGILKIENIRDWLKKANIDEDLYTEIETAYATLRQRGNTETTLLEAINAKLGARMTRQLAETLRKAAIKPPRKDTAVRQAIVLGPTSFCVLLDEDGKPQTKQGPGRIFPGPYDRFRTEGSDNGVYQAYHLRTDRGILLRIVADISRDDLLRQLPQGSELPEDKEQYVKGDEIFIGGFDSYFVPSNVLEVINPKTRQPHIGNKHSEAYVAAIGVDQKSGVYVADVETGNIQTIHGEKKLLLDPRRQKHVLRKIPASTWNLIIGRNEPHKEARNPNELIETPWAMSVTVPNNEAILIVGKSGRRPIVGPCTELLDYEETLEVLTLSTQTPKTDKSQLSTCFLRVSGNRISDKITIITKDFVELEVTVSYGVTFAGTSKDDQAAWFNHKDYVKLLCDNERSRLRAAARQFTLADIYPVLAEFVRDTVLGKKDGEHRPGHKFNENNMVVDEVEVLEININDDEIADSLGHANQKVVALAINGVAATAELEAMRKTAEIEAEKSRLRLESIARSETEQLTQLASGDRIATEKLKLDQELSKQRQTLEAAYKQAEQEGLTLLADIARAREDANNTAMVKREEEERTALVSFRERLADIEKTLLAAHAEADVNRLKAIQPSLVEAIEGMGDKQVLAELAKHLPAATGELGYMLGTGGLGGLVKMLGNLPLAQTLDKIGTSLEDMTSQAKAAVAEAKD